MQITSLKGSPLSLQQLRIWSFQRDQQPYRAQCTFLLQGPLDQQVLQEALQNIIERHEIFRTTFYTLPGMDTPVQCVQDSTKIICQELDFEGLDPSIQAAQMDAIFTLMDEAPIESEGALPLHALLFKLSENSHALLLSLPSLCADAFTLRFLLGELSQGYAARMQGLDLADVAEVPLQYADVAPWQNDLPVEEDAEEQRAYWRQIDLAGLSPQRLPVEATQHRSIDG